MPIENNIYSFGIFVIFCPSSLYVSNNLSIMIISTAAIELHWNFNYYLQKFIQILNYYKLKGLVVDFGQN